MCVFCIMTLDGAVDAYVVMCCAGEKRHDVNPSRSVRQSCTINDDELMGLSTPSIELNACDVSAIFKIHVACNTHGATARPNGTMWDLSSTEDKSELRRLQLQEQSEFLARSPPSADFLNPAELALESREERDEEKRKRANHTSRPALKLTSCKWR